MLTQWQGLVWQAESGFLELYLFALLCPYRVVANRCSFAWDG
jgi:hypothetical protein